MYSEMDEPFYDDLTPFEQEMDELRETLLASVKKEFTDEMARLRQENAELQSIRRDFDKIKRDYAQKERELAGERNRAMENARRERLDQLMSGRQATLYRARPSYESLPKCDTCDHNRYLHYKTPLGNDAKEKCTCYQSRKVYSAEPSLLYEFRINIHKREMTAFYRYSDEYDSMSDAVHSNQLYQEGQSYEGLDPYRTYFQSEVDCEAFCRYLASKQE
jgi:uncharacterized protein YdcH (DUF465 family)